MREKLLETERLYFSLWSEIDISLAKQLWKNPKVTHFIAKNGCLSKDQVIQRLSLEIQSQEEFCFQYWPLFLKQTDMFVGCCGLHQAWLLKLLEQ